MERQRCVTEIIFIARATEAYLSFACAQKRETKRGCTEWPCGSRRRRERREERECEGARRERDQGERGEEERIFFRPLPLTRARAQKSKGEREHGEREEDGRIFFHPLHLTCACTHVRERCASKRNDRKRKEMRN